ncbi:MAG: hypothetical protein KatS3mg059_0974 [Thermomicrobiales bacterium]|nr:MAG: hypothetical protein KatS3mg059_0974 [Thermomicrobiales bacterium]
MSDDTVTGKPAFIWQGHSRFVEIVPVRTGWLVVWGRVEGGGAARVILGNRIYRSVPGVRRRLADAVLTLTGKRSEARDALALLDRRGLPEHQPQPLPPPL